MSVFFNEEIGVVCVFHVVLSGGIRFPPNCLGFLCTALMFRLVCVGWLPEVSLKDDGSCAQEPPGLV